MVSYNRNEYKMKQCVHSQYSKKFRGEQCQENDNIWGIDMSKCVRMPRQNASYEERGKKDRNKVVKRRLIKHSNPEGNMVYIHRNLCNNLDDQYITAWDNHYVHAWYCRDETGSNWRDFLDPPPYGVQKL